MVKSCEISEISGESNTNPPEIIKEKEVQRKYWAFTFFYNDATNQIDMIKRFEITFIKGCFGRELCPTSNRPHWQGFATARGKGYRFSQLKKQYPSIHWSPTYANEEQNLAYCKKDGDYHQWGYPRPVATISELRPWQKSAFDMLQTVPDGRSIIWISDAGIGNVGKSSFCKYMLVHHNATYIDNCKKSDIYNHISNTDMDKCSTVLIDIPRNCGNQCSYSAIESILNGIIFNSKYECSMKVFNAVHVMVFSNCYPEKSKLSQDRWKCYEIRDGSLINLSISVS